MFEMREAIARTTISPARRCLLAVAGTLWLAIGAGCSLIIDSSETQCARHSDCSKLFGADTELVCVQNFCVQPTCSTDADCTQLGGSYADKVCVEQACVEPDPASQEPPEWACLDTPREMMSRPGPFKVQMHVQDVVSQAPSVGVTARVCRKLDTNCDSPQSTTMSDQAGDLTLSVAAGFTGYIWLTRSDVVPTLYFFDVAVDRDLTVASISLLPPIVAQVQSTMVGTTYKADRGLLVVTAFNCGLVGNSGVSISSPDADGEAVTWYSSAGLPSRTLTETDTSGVAGFVNAPPGSFVVEGRRSADDRIVGIASIAVKPGELSIVRLTPRSML